MGSFLSWMMSPCLDSLVIAAARIGEITVSPARLRTLSYVQQVIAFTLKSSSKKNW